MATMFGRFEIQSELSRSDTALIYKALDTTSNQVVALKTQSLEPLGNRAAGFVQTLLAEGEEARGLAGQNLVLLYGAGEIEGQFCAAMEYIQGNSIATMLARKEGFSIWDLLDITRQVCSGLEQAAVNKVAHHSLEPAKIMVQWDGTVKILGYGISNMSLIEAESGKGLGRLMPYCSPEQIRGEGIDLRSNLFTLGAILYEMVVSERAFDAIDPVALLSQIENDMPPSPDSVNAKIHPAVSALIMKALAKDPAERYRSARELVVDLEKCKESSTAKKASPDAKKLVAVPVVTVDAAARAAAASKFLSNASDVAKPAAPAPAAAVRPAAAAPVRPAAAQPVAARPAAAPVPGVPAVASKPVSPKVAAPAAPRPNPAAPQPIQTTLSPRAAAAAAGAGSPAGVAKPVFRADSKTSSGPNSNSSSGSRLIEELPAVLKYEPPRKSAPSSAKPPADPGPVMSSAVAEPEPEVAAPRAFDPLMSGAPAGASSTSFSDMAEMPPLKAPVYAPSIPEPAEPSRSTVQIYPRKEEKPRIQPREVAGKAMKEISTVPPRLMLYSILGAVGLILVIALGIFFHVRSEDDGSTAAPQAVKVAKSSADQPEAQPPVAQAVEAPAPPITDDEPSLTVRPTEKPAPHRRAPARPAARVVIPGQATIDSSPQGAQFQVDGKSNSTWVTPFTLAGLTPGRHIISGSKAGYSSDIRSIEVANGGKASLTLHLSPVNALVVVNSTPPGAEVILDGKATGRVTPAQFAVEKGSHSVLLRKQGYLDETVTADLAPAQNFQYSPALRVLGNIEALRTVGKLNKIFGHGGDSTAGMGTISVHTQPKGAQVAINQRVLEKLSPVEVMLGPGNFIVDITMTGFKPVHKIVNVDKGGKAAIDEVLERP